ncbi:MAG TPA: hemerythrin domain-containing protein [Burkholderiales bacterium]|nr:hemerythrin domain-containing protein [Burkholderiales bacterium]
MDTIGALKAGKPPWRAASMPAEEEHLFPFLRARAGELGRPEVSAVINDVQTDHHILEQVWSRLRQPLAAIAQGREAVLDARDVAAFAWLYRHPMDEESAVILPFAREALA